MGSHKQTAHARAHHAYARAPARTTSFSAAAHSRTRLRALPRTPAALWIRALLRTRTTRTPAVHAFTHLFTFAAARCVGCWIHLGLHACAARTHFHAHTRAPVLLPRFSCRLLRVSCARTLLRFASRMGSGCSYASHKRICCAQNITRIARAHTQRFLNVCCMHAAAACVHCTHAHARACHCTFSLHCCFATLSPAAALTACLSGSSGGGSMRRKQCLYLYHNL